MAFVPSEIDMSQRQRITDTKWSYIQQSPTMRFYYHDHLPAFGDESYHVSVFMRQYGIDIHATFVYRDKRTGEWYKRHHGWCFNKNTNQQVKKKCRRPAQLRNLFNSFQADVENILESYYLQFLPAAFFQKFQKNKDFILFTV